VVGRLTISYVLALNVARNAHWPSKKPASPFGWQPSLECTPRDIACGYIHGNVTEVAAIYELVWSLAGEFLKLLVEGRAVRIQE
jgi:hypothetical protein